MDWWMHAQVMDPGRAVARIRSRAEEYPSRAGLLALQRTAGNSAVGGLLWRWRSDGERDALRVQRQGFVGPLTLLPARITATTADLPQAPSGLGPPPRLPDDEEAAYRAQGESKLADVGGGVSSSGATAGHTTVGPIEGFPDWFAYTPTYSASDSMTWTTVTTFYSAFCMIGGVVVFNLLARGTVGGTPSYALQATVPVTAANASALGGGAHTIENGADKAGAIYGQTTTRVGALIASGGNWGAAANTGFQMAIAYPAE